jgi:hypothetical protein
MLGVAAGAGVVVGVLDGWACGVPALHEVVTAVASSRQFSSAIGRGTRRR